MYKGVVVLLLMVLIAWPAQAQTQANCKKREELVKVLEKKYSEYRRVYALTKQMMMMEIFVSKKNGTWTVLYTNAEKISCIVGAGEGWTEVKVEEGEGL